MQKQYPIDEQVNLNESYHEIMSDAMREQEATEWCNALIGELE